MCGIVGLLLKKPALRPALGELMLPMFVGMTERGPDSGGLAVYGDAAAGDRRKFSLYAGDGARRLGCPGAERHGALRRLRHRGQRQSCDRRSRDGSRCDGGVDRRRVSRARAAFVGPHHGPVQGHRRAGRHRRSAMASASSTGTHLVGPHAHGHRIGRDARACASRSPSATISASCTTARCPIPTTCAASSSAKASPSRPTTTPRPRAATSAIASRRATTSPPRWTAASRVLDGFYTLLIGTHDSLAIVRDPFACKPAIVAETDDYVAISSEYRSLAALPGVKSARLFEPRPRQLYQWRVQ